MKCLWCWCSGLGCPCANMYDVCICVCIRCIECMYIHTLLRQGLWWCWRCCGLGCLSPWFSSAHFWAIRRTPFPCLSKPIPFPDRFPPSCGTSASLIPSFPLPFPRPSLPSSLPSLPSRLCVYVCDHVTLDRARYPLP
jgi:hypothetical protein